MKSKAISLLLALSVWSFPTSSVAQTDATLQFNTQYKNKQPESVIHKTDGQINENTKGQPPRMVKSVQTNKAPKTGRKLDGKNVSHRLSYPAEAIGEIQITAKTLVTERWGESEWPIFKAIINKESGWCPTKWNGQRTCPEIPTPRPSNSSGAYGLCQALPATKMASAGSDYMTNSLTQTHWCINYIAGRYQTPSKALQFHQSHNWF